MRGQVAHSPHHVLWRLALPARFWYASPEELHVPANHHSSFVRCGRSTTSGKVASWRKEASPSFQETCNLISHVEYGINVVT